MSADNYWLIRSHPDGDGFTYVMGFMSDDRPVDDPSPQSPRFATLGDATRAAQADGWTEYGLVYLMSDPMVAKEMGHVGSD